MTLSRSCSRTEREENRQTGPMGHWLLEEIMASGRDYGFWKRLWLLEEIMALQEVSCQSNAQLAGLLFLSVFEVRQGAIRTPLDLVKL